MSSAADSQRIQPNKHVYNFFSVKEMFERLRQQMLHLMSQVPLAGASPQGGNTTSVTKVTNPEKSSFRNKI